MSSNPFNPPRSPVADVVESIPRPRQVTIAVALLWLVLLLSLPILHLTIERTPDEDLQGFMIGISVVSLVGAAILNVFIYRGSNVARIITLVLFILGVITLAIPSEDGDQAGWLEISLDTLSILLQVMALYLVFSKPGALWFRSYD